MVELGSQAEQDLRAVHELTSTSSNDPWAALQRLRGQYDDLARTLAHRTEALERARSNGAFLAAATKLLSFSLDYETTLASIARLAVPTLADWCTVDILDGDRVRRLAITHTDPQKQEVARELARRYPPTLDRQHGVAQVLRTGRPLLIPVMSDEVLDGVATNDEHRRALGALGFRSAMIVPLIARERTLGSLCFISAESGRLYRHQDLDLAEELAALAALAVDNARLYTATLQASEAKSSFLAIMSHELRTPLTSMLGYAELLADGITGPVTPAQLEQLRRIGASGRHLLSLIEEILTFSRLEKGREGILLERVNLQVLARQAASVAEPLATQKGLNFTLSVPGQPLVAETDAMKVRQILINLLINAINFTQRGDVQLEVAADDTWVRLSVRDTGVGIPGHDLERVFEPFWQAGHCDTRTVGGTGIGLSVARRFARLLGGDITVASEVGLGSSFTLRLPRPSAELSPRP
ncbi:MAG TPA: HAMP domain-containing sensor histidine kinase [Gemmatimonadaceae bacterium]|nr:HAMP domain-containing sensor histidine kinase [Gemmatimonadaceae bacterium]